jgi:hypothetical protein
VMQQPCGTAEERSAPSAPGTLGSSRWKSVCTHAQVFGENCINSSANNQQKGRR